MSASTNFLFFLFIKSREHEQLTSTWVMNERMKKDNHNINNIIINNI